MEETKINDIEIMVAHHEQQIQELNDVITDQWKQIDLLNRRLDKALSKIERIESAEPSAGEIVDKPPHY